ncbi:unnamed protein product [Mytilus edulis]|uniref:C2H2-type domain-containing protein n=1 Tax=Mytilus edulis TaxID=6550 RepID=A0A8S3V3P7_MYTED|nr:unnamed protein product [Mytilus edulis]
MIDQLVKVIPQDVLQKLQQLSAQDFNAVLQSVKQQNPTEKQLDQSTMGKDGSVTNEDNVSNFECQTCGMRYARKDHLIRHQQNHSNINYECEHCGFTTKRKDVLTKHMKRKHDVKKKRTEGRRHTTPRKRQRIEDVGQLPEERVRNAREKDQFIKNGSGWQLEEVLQLDLCVTKYKPLKGGSYLELPTSLKRSNCILNIQNLDNKCFLWTVLSSMHNFQQNPENVENYVPFVNSVNMTGIEYPTPLSQISQFEKQNTTISVNIFGYEEGEIYPLYITKKTFCHHVNILYLKENNKSHYVLINNFNRFLSRTKKHREEHFFCYLCLQGFTDKCKLERHKADCGKFDFQKITLPKEGEVLNSKNMRKPPEFRL